MKRPVAEIDLSISTDQVCFIIIKAREFEVTEASSGLEAGSNASDDRMVAVLEARRNDPVFAEIKEFINALDVDQQIDLVALAWVGRGDFDMSEWAMARDEAAAAHNNRTAEYLLGMPLLSEFLEDALSDAGRSCEDLEREHL
jgi:Protein of unknown function (DUF3775)